MNNKPFDYEKAKSGAPVVDIAGNTVTELVKFDVKDQYKYRGVVDHFGIKSIDAYRDIDLFMVPVEKELAFYVNVYAGFGQPYIGGSHATEQAALKVATSSDIIVKAHKVVIKYEE